MTLFGLPDVISGWRNASLLQRLSVVAAASLLSFFGGFSYAAGEAWANGAIALVGLGVGLSTGAKVMFAILAALGFPVAMPREVAKQLEEDIKVEKGKGK